MNTVHYSKASTDWSTPLDLFERLNDTYKFTKDVCASTVNYKVRDYWTIKDDALSKDWSEFICWCNPPYSECKQWIEKAYNESLKGTKIVMLIPARTDTVAFHKYIYNKPNIRIEFLKGRLKFSNSRNSAPFPSMLVYFNL